MYTHEGVIYFYDVPGTVGVTCQPPLRDNPAVLRRNVEYTFLLGNLPAIELLVPPAAAPSHPHGPPTLPSTQTAIAVSWLSWESYGDWSPPVV